MQRTTQIILSIFILSLSYPIAIILTKYTKDEKPIYKRYFQVMLWPIAILAATFYTININIALTLTFIFLLVFFWNRE